MEVTSAYLHRLKVPARGAAWTTVNLLAQGKLPNTRIWSLILLGLCISIADTWVVSQPGANVWKVLASAMGQDHICLNGNTADSPLTASLVGIPVIPEKLPEPLGSAFIPLLPAHGKNSFGQYPRSAWATGVGSLPRLSAAPQELELLGSNSAPLCFQFSPPWQVDPVNGSFTIFRQHKLQFMSKQWCLTTILIPSPTSLDSPAFQLPRGTFFICGDRAWVGIPSRFVGGPCTLGQLSLFSPTKHQIVNWIKINESSKLAPKKRDLTNVSPDCDSDITHWGYSRRMATTILLPWAGIAKALGELGQLECWVLKQANVTSAALADLLSDEETTRRATLQNRAAIDFLLLLNHHTCEEFEGLCCFNLSSKAEDARLSIRKLEDMVHQIKEDNSDWLGDTFKGLGLSGWASSLLKDACIVGVIIIILVVFWNLVKCLLFQRVSSTPTVNAVIASPPKANSETDSAEYIEMQTVVMPNQDYPYPMDLPFQGLPE
ncbi:syncytin-A-like [Geothlypis trichas]